MINSGAIAYLLLWVRQVCQTKDGFFFFKYILRGRESGVFLLVARICEGHRVFPELVLTVHHVGQGSNSGS